MIRPKPKLSALAQSMQGARKRVREAQQKPTVPARKKNAPRKRPRASIQRDAHSPSSDSDSSCRGVLPLLTI